MYRKFYCAEHKLSLLGISVMQTRPNCLLMNKLFHKFHLQNGLMNSNRDIEIHFSSILVTRSKQKTSINKQTHN